MHRTQKLLERNEKWAQKISLWKENPKGLRNSETATLRVKLQVCVSYKSEKKYLKTWAVLAG